MTLHTTYSKAIQKTFYTFLAILSFVGCNKCDRNSNGNSPSPSYTSRWSTPPSVSRAYTITLVGLEAGGYIDASNKFIIKIAKTGAGGVAEDIKAAELSDLEVNFTVNPDVATNPKAAMLVGISSPLVFVNGDLKDGKIEKEIVIERKHVDTTFTFTLQHPTIRVSAAVNAIAASKLNVKIALADPSKLTYVFGEEFECTVTAGPYDLDVEDLEAINLVYTIDSKDVTKPADISLTYLSAGGYEDGTIYLASILNNNLLSAHTSASFRLKPAFDVTCTEMKIKDLKLEESAAPDKVGNYIAEELTFKPAPITMELVGNHTIFKGYGKNFNFRIKIIAEEAINSDILKGLQFTYKSNERDFVKICKNLPGLAFKKLEVGGEELYKYIIDFTLDELLGKTSLEAGDEEEIEVELYGGQLKNGQSFPTTSFECKNIQIVGARPGNTIPSITLEP